MEKKSKATTFSVAINLGSGRSNLPGTMNIDVSAKYDPDLIWDLNNGIPLPNSSVTRVTAKHVLEHLDDLIFQMNEIWRVCKHGAQVYIEVPHEDSVMANADPTHVRRFNEHSFLYFCNNGEHYWAHEEYGIGCEFELLHQDVSRDKRRGYVRVSLKVIKE